MTKADLQVLLVRWTRESPSGVLTLSMHGVEELLAECERLEARVDQLEARAA